MKVLVDTSVWVGHFKQRNERLVSLLEEGAVVCHPYIVVEIACGTPPRRRAVIAMLTELDSTPVATHDEVLALVERRSLHGRGCGFVDLALVASALMAGGARLWTLDRRLASAARECGIEWRPATA